MKILFLFTALFAKLTFADYTYIGDLVDFDEQVISTCSLKSKTKLFSRKRIVLKEVTFLDESFTKYKMKKFSKNGINGNAYLPAVRDFSDYSFMLNTNSEYRIVELAINAGIGTLEDSYRCINFYEE